MQGSRAALLLRLENAQVGMIRKLSNQFDMEDEDGPDYARLTQSMRSLEATLSSTDEQYSEHLAEQYLDDDDDDDEHDHEPEPWYDNHNHNENHDHQPEPEHPQSKTSDRYLEHLEEVQELLGHRADGNRRNKGEAADTEGFSPFK